MRTSSWLPKNKALLCIIALGLAVRLAVLFLYLWTHNWQGETWEYEAIARNLLEGQGYIFIFHGTEYRSHSVPVFPLICYVLHVLGGPGLGLYYVFHLSVALGIIVLTYAICSRWFKERAALIAALLVALEPGIVIYHSYKVDPGALSTLLLLLNALLFNMAVDSLDKRMAYAAGAVIGIGMLTRPDIVAAFGGVAFWGFIQLLRKRLAVALALTIPLCMAAVLTLAPWVVRNYLIHGEFLVTYSVSSELFWRGNNPNSTGTTVTLSNEGQFEKAPEAFREKVNSSKEMEIYALFQKQAWQFIVQHPLGFLRRSVEKLWYFWWFTPTYAANYYEWIPAVVADAYKFVYVSTLCLAITGGWFIVRKGSTDARRVSAFLLAVVLSIALVHCIGYVEGRHRVLVMPIILIWAAHGIVGLMDLGSFNWGTDNRAWPGSKPLSLDRPIN